MKWIGKRAEYKSEIHHQIQVLSNDYFHFNGGVSTSHSSPHVQPPHLPDQVSGHIQPHLPEIGNLFTSAAVYSIVLRIDAHCSYSLIDICRLDS